MTRRILVLGDGAWGRALAQVCAANGHAVTVWSRTAPAPDATVTAAEAAIVAIPAQAMGQVLPLLPLRPDAAIIIAAKGIERGSLRLTPDVARAACPSNPALVLSGPSFAGDVLKGLPTAVALAAPTLALADEWASVLARPSFRIYGTDDLAGVALGGAVKNVLAIACGISDGHGLGESARAALIARGFSELTRLGRQLGARPETLMGLSGLGDLLLTCSSPQSRNYAFGFRIGQGQAVEQAVAAASGVVEGVFTAQATQALAQKHGIDMPITAAVQAIVEGGSRPAQEIEKLLQRPPAREFLT